MNETALKDPAWESDKLYRFQMNSMPWIDVASDLRIGMDVAFEHLR